MSFPIGEPINGEVSNQLTVLQNLLSNKITGNAGTAEIAYYLNSKTPWIKLTSAALLEEGSDIAEFFGKTGNQLAKENVLFNLDPTNKTEGVPAGYEYTALYGARPRPGITNMSIHSHNRYGSLRTATVNFTVFDPQQLAIMEVLYMRPGYSVILEFGHSLNISITEPEIQPAVMQEENGFEKALREQQFDGNFNIDRILEEATVTAQALGYEVTQTSKGIDFFQEDRQYTSTQLYDLIREKRADNNYAYDGIYGLVDYFNWSLRPDGGYDCTTRIVSRGTVIESLTTNITSVIANIGEVKSTSPAIVNERERQAAVVKSLNRNEQSALTNSQEDLAFAQELVAANVGTFFDANSTDRTYKQNGIAIPGIVNDQTQLQPFFLNGIPKDRELLKIETATEQYPNGTVTIPIYTYRFL